MTSIDLENILSEMIEWSPKLFQSDELDTTNYFPLGISVKLEKGLSVKRNDFISLFTFIKENLSSDKSGLSDTFIYQTIVDFLIKTYSEKHRKTEIEELLKLFNLLEYKEINIFVKIFNLVTDIGEYDCGSFIIYDPMYFKQKFNNPFMYSKINDQSTANSDNISHVGLVFKNIKLFKEDKEQLNFIILEKISEFINFTGVALGEKESAQKLAANFNHIGMEYHLLDNDMIEESSSFSSIGSTFLKGNVKLKTELFFKNHEMLFKLLSKRDNQLKQKIYKSVLWLGKSMQTENVTDSFLQVSVALECLLSRQVEGYLINPSIAYSLSETLAFLVADNKDVRIKIFKELKKLYGLRSSIVHSGKSNINIQQYNDYFELIRIGIYKILDLIENKKVNSIDEIYDIVEQLKFK